VKGIRPDLADKTDMEIIETCQKDLLLAKETRAMMPNGFALEEKDGFLGSIAGHVSKIGHICRVVKDAEVSMKFYTEVIGCSKLNRPKFATNGYWLWLGNTQLHLIESDLAIPPDHPDGGTRVNHISFDCYDFDDCVKRIEEAGITYKKVFVPEGDSGINQIFFQDPDQHWIELCDCHKFADFVFGEFDEARALDLRKFYLEGVEPTGSFLATMVFMLLCQLNKDASHSPIHDMFMQYAGSDGNISVGEMAVMIQRMSGTEFTIDQVKKLFVGMDESKDGGITYDEFRKYLVNHVLEADPADIAPEIFKAVDKNSTGTITGVEFTACFRNLNLDISDERVNQLFQQTDKDLSGTITLDEFMTLYDVFKAEIGKAAEEA